MTQALGILEFLKSLQRKNMFDDICSFGNFDGRIAPCEPMDWWPAHTKIGHDVWFGTGVFCPWGA